jgi:hypothetical protein
MCYSLGLSSPSTGVDVHIDDITLLEATDGEKDPPAHNDTHTLQQQQQQQAKSQSVLFELLSAMNYFIWGRSSPSKGSSSQSDERGGGSRRARSAEGGGVYAANDVSIPP